MKNPNDVFVLEQEGASLNQLQRFEMAIQLFDEALAIKPGTAPAICFKAISLCGLGGIKEAILMPEGADKTETDPEISSVFREVMLELKSENANKT